MNSINLPEGGIPSQANYVPEGESVTKAYLLECQLLRLIHQEERMVDYPYLNQETGISRRELVAAVEDNPYRLKLSQLEQALQVHTEEGYISLVKFLYRAVKTLSDEIEEEEDQIPKDILLPCEEFEHKEIGPKHFPLSEFEEKPFSFNTFFNEVNEWEELA